MFSSEVNYVLSSTYPDIFEGLDRIGLKIIENRSSHEVMEEAEFLLENIANYFTRFRGNDFDIIYFDPSEYLEINKHSCINTELGYAYGRHTEWIMEYLAQPLIIAKHLKIKNVVNEIPELNNRKISYKSVYPQELSDLYTGKYIIESEAQLLEINGKIEEVYNNISPHDHIHPEEYIDFMMSFLDNSYHYFDVASFPNDYEVMRNQVKNNPNRNKILKDLVTKFFTSLKTLEDNPFSSLHYGLNQWWLSDNKDLYDEDIFKRQLKDYILTEDKTYNLGLLEIGVYDAFKEMVNNFEFSE